MNDLRMRYNLCLVLAMLFTGWLAAAQDEATLELRFDAPMTSMINARAWDQTRQQWQKAPGEELFFDGVHRFLLIRFPGSAEAIHAKLAEGYTLERATLELTWENQEWNRVDGYACRQFSLVRAGREPACWHARVHALRFPWLDDPQLGPTWNAYLNGVGHWRRGGAFDAADRYPEPLGKQALCEDQPLASIDVTAAMASERANAGVRLRAFESCGLLVQRDEVSNPEFGSYALSTGAARIFVREPRLIVTLRRAADAAAPGALPPAIDLVELAERLRAAGGDGQPSTRIPDNLPELAAQRLADRRGDMPEWMWNRVQEVMHIRHPSGYANWFKELAHAMEAGDRDGLAKAVDSVLSRPPGWAQGHQRIEFSLPLYHFGDALPEVARYHLRLDFPAALPEPLTDPYTQLYKIASMGTLNHMANARPTWLLGAQMAGRDEIIEAAHFGLTRLSRKMIYSDGFTSEHGDSYYRGITMTPLQEAARFAEDPLIRLTCSLMVERLLFEDISTYHPGLRKRVSRISRRSARATRLLLEQDVPEAAMHTLSREGVLLHLDVPGEAPTVHDVPVFGFTNTPTARVAMVAPWGREWEANAIDRKPLPFRHVASAMLYGWTNEPVHITTWMGQNYALGSEELPTYSTIPIFGSWRREAQTVDHLDDFGILLLQGRLNEQPPSEIDKTPFGALQRDNKLLWAVKTQERKFVVEGHGNLPAGVKDGLTSFKAQVSLIAYGPDDAREILVNGQPVSEFPHVARHGDRIAIRDGVTYLGLIPIAASDFGRTHEVIIRREHPYLMLDSYVMQRETAIAGDDDATWAGLQEATAAWAVELGDESEHGSFASFVAHLAAAEATARWEADEHLLHLAYRSGDETLEMGFRTDWARDRDLWHDPRNPSDVFSYRRVNGEWPWLAPGIVLDNPLGQMGKAALLEKGGASLTTREGQMAFLRVEPISGTYVGINPFFDPTPFELRTPEGARIRAEGELGLARVVVQAGAASLWVDYALPAAGGNPGIERLQQQQPRWFQEGVDVRTARDHSAKALLVNGLGDNPTVVLNGEPLAGPFATVQADGLTWLRVPIVRP